MKLIIDIPEIYYEALSKTEEIVSSQRSGKTLMSVIYSAVAKGTPLDVLDKIRKEVLEYIDDLDIAYEICGVFDKYRVETDGKQMSSEDEKDNRCGNCVHWKNYEFCNHWKEQHCENKDSPYYLRDTHADTQCSAFKRNGGE